MLSLFFRFSYLSDSGQLGVPRGAFPLGWSFGLCHAPRGVRTGTGVEDSGALAWKQQFK